MARGGNDRWSCVLGQEGYWKQGNVHSKCSLPGVLCPVPGCPVERCGPIRTGPEEGHRNGQRIGALLLERG